MLNLFILQNWNCSHHAKHLINKRSYKVATEREIDQAWHFRRLVNANSFKRDILGGYWTRTRSTVTFLNFPPEPMVTIVWALSKLFSLFAALSFHSETLNLDTNAQHINRKKKTIYSLFEFCKCFKSGCGE